MPAYTLLPIHRQILADRTFVGVAHRAPLLNSFGIIAR